MPSKPTMEVAFTPEFKRNLRALAKGYNLEYEPNSYS